jgi:hypothetical protein
MEEQHSDDDDENKKRASQKEVHLTIKELKKLENGVFKDRGLKNLKKLMTAYRGACHLADSAEDKGSRPGESGIHYIIDDSAVFDRLMITCLSGCHEIFYHHLFPKRDEKAKSDEGKEGSDNDDDDLIDVAAVLFHQV